MISIESTQPLGGFCRSDAAMHVINPAAIKTNTMNTLEVRLNIMQSYSLNAISVSVKDDAEKYYYESGHKRHNNVW